MEATPIGGMLSRIVIIASMLLGVWVGVWPLVAQTTVALAIVLLVGVIAAWAWRRHSAAAIAVLAAAYISYGLVRLLAGPVVAGIPFWLAALIGLALGGAGWRRWTSPAPWRFALGWWATSVAVSWPVVTARELALRFEPSPATSAIATAALVQMSVALLMDRLLTPDGADDTAVRASIRDGQSDQRAPESRPALEWALAAGALVTALAAMYQRFVDPAWMSGEPWISLGRTPGLMGDANPMGVATAVWAPLTLALVLYGRTGPSYSARGGSRRRVSMLVLVGWAAALLLWAAAWTSGARSTLILMGSGAAGLAAAWAVARGIGWRSIAITLAAGAAAAGLALVVLLPRAGSATPLGRLMASLPSSPSAVAYELFWRRDGYGLAAMQAIREKPINGIGIGLFPGRSPLFFAQTEARAIPPDNAQNLWRHTMAERGVLGLLPVLWLTVLVLRDLLRPTRDPFAVATRAMILGLGAVLTFGYPVQDAAIAASLGLLVARHHEASLHPPPVAPSNAGSSSHAGAVWSAIFALCLLGAVLDAVLGR